MVTIGRGVLDPAVHDFFEGLRSYDVARAVKPLAADVDFESPWTAKLTGRPAVEQFLSTWLKDPVKRPSLSIMDVAGDGAVTRVRLSISGRFGRRPSTSPCTRSSCSTSSTTSGSWRTGRPGRTRRPDHEVHKSGTKPSVGFVVSLGA